MPVTKACEPDLPALTPERLKFESIEKFEIGLSKRSVIVRLVDIVESPACIIERNLSTSSMFGLLKRPSVLNDLRKLNGYPPF